MRYLVRALFISLLASLLAIGCGSDPGTGVLVVGVTSDLQAGVDIDRLEVVMVVDDAEVSSQSYSLGISAGLLDFPAEFSLTDVADGMAITVSLRGYEDDILVIERHLRTTGVTGRKLLYHAHLEGQCAQYPPGSPNVSGPICAGPAETCVAGKCHDSTVPASALEPYRDDWMDTESDACKPAGGGTPEVIVGSGQSDFLSTEDYAVAQVEAGPQGGHHIWIAARIKHLAQSGSITTVGGEIPDLGLSISPLKVIFTMDPDEGGYCKLYGLRFQIDIDGDDVDAMLGHAMKMTVSIQDPTGKQGSGQRWVTLGDTIL